MEAAVGVLAKDRGTEILQLWNEGLRIVIVNLMLKQSPFSP
jgi:hypothetical protein